MSTTFSIIFKVVGVDKTITNNIELERQCGTHCNRLRKKPPISTVSSGNILKYSNHLRNEDSANLEIFHKMGTIRKMKVSNTVGTSGR